MPESIILGLKLLGPIKGERSSVVQGGPMELVHTKAYASLSLRLERSEKNSVVGFRGSTGFTGFRGSLGGLGCLGALGGSGGLGGLRGLRGFTGFRVWQVRAGFRVLALRAPHTQHRYV